MTVFVGNLAWDIDEDTLKEAFKECGEIKMVRFATDRETEEFKGYGHLEFYETEATDKAVKMAGTNILGRPIRVDYANDRRKNYNGGGGGGRGNRFGGRGGGRDYGGGRGGRGRGGFGRGRGGGGRFGDRKPGFGSKKHGSIAEFKGNKITFD